MKNAVPDDIESEVVNVDDAGRAGVRRIRATVDVRKVRESGVIWENQVEYKVKRDSGQIVGTDFDKNFDVGRKWDLEVDQHPPNIARVFLFEVQPL